MKSFPNIAKPFLKWAGGKGQLLSQLEAALPYELNDEEFTYIEPFVGGGAMMFFMLQSFPNIKRAVINDINNNLTDAYKTELAEGDSIASFTVTGRTGAASYSAHPLSYSAEVILGFHL